MTSPGTRSACGLYGLPMARACAERNGACVPSGHACSTLCTPPDPALAREPHCRYAPDLRIPPSPSCLAKGVRQAKRWATLTKVVHGVRVRVGEGWVTSEPVGLSTSWVLPTCGQGSYPRRARTLMRYAFPATWTTRAAAVRVGKLVLQFVEPDSHSPLSELASGSAERRHLHFYRVPALACVVRRSLLSALVLSAHARAIGRPTSSGLHRASGEPTRKRSARLRVRSCTVLNGDLS